MSSDSKKSKKSKSKKSKSKKTKKKSKKKKSKRTKKKSKKNKPDCRMIWLYGAHSYLLTMATKRLLEYGSDESIRLKEQLGINLNDFVIPVHPYPAGPRLNTIKQLRKVEGVVVLVIGLQRDMKSSRFKKLYEGAEAAWLHPHEQQFHVDMMRRSDDISFKKAEDKMQEGMKYLNKHFDENDIKIIR